ncbi:hypothetical protein CEXT_321421 [Caerostris extrusa]|uniref:Uncharacterized protein n=1 Tax=Caerostris extrusa TaxID=172846 RepID=A0AAV4X593_CAEEX|nr:hypothetical protein CEXT_321421 [Caerostris extrusa]
MARSQWKWKKRVGVMHTWCLSASSGSQALSGNRPSQIRLSSLVVIIFLIAAAINATKTKVLNQRFCQPQEFRSFSRSWFEEK